MLNQEITAELKKISDRNGGLLRPLDVVETARAEDSPLHSRFEWDDSLAAEKHRLNQARELIRVCVSLITTSDNRVIRVGTFVSLTPDRDNPGGGYRQIDVVMENPEQREQLLRDALSELEAFRTKYSHLRELVDLFQAIDNAKNQAA